MQDLYSLIHSLTSSEWQSLQSYFTCFTPHDESKSKYLELASLLMNSGECPSGKSCCLKIYGVKRDPNFEKLKSRLKEKIMDFLLTDISCDKQKELDEADYNIIKITKKTAQFRQLFYSKNRLPLLYGLLNEIIFLAKEYEQYSIVVEHLRIKKGLVSWNKGGAEFEKIDSEMGKYFEYNRLVNKAEHYYYKLIMQYEYEGNPNIKKISSFLKKAIEDVRNGYELTESPLINYRLKMLELDLYQMNKDFLKARSTCLELLAVVRNNKSVYRKQRVGIVYDQISRCEFYLGNFKQAAESAIEAQKNFNLNSENYCIALEQEFYSLFAMKQYGQSMDIANKMISSATPKELGEFRFSKYNYLLANALFKLKRFEEARQLLSQTRAISKDKAGWEIGARVLGIMTQVEMLKLSEASSAIESLRKFIDYTNKKTPVSTRDKTILDLLIGAERKGFMFSQLNGKTEGYLAILNSSDKKTKWEPFTHEVIPFHEWFSGKMKKHILPVSPVKELAPVKKKKEKVVSRTR
jgi:tetratricopeptide (TPR) repeat protein